MPVPVEQLEIAIPQGYGLFIKTIFQASSSPEPSEFRFGGQIEYLWQCPHLPTSLWSAPASDLAIHGRENISYFLHLNEGY